MAAPEMTSTRTWGTFFDPYWGGGAKWRPYRFRSPSWMTSFPVPQMRSSKMAAGSGRAAILHLPLNGDRKKYPILLPVTGELPAQRASNAESVSIWWRHRVSISRRYASMKVTQMRPPHTVLWVFKLLKEYLNVIPSFEMRFIGDLMQSEVTCYILHHW